MKSTFLFLAMFTTGIACQAQSSKPTALPELEFTNLMKVVPPAASEDPFMQIPWETNLWQARIKAAKEGKPILLWEMDGHPLGCG